MTDLPIARNTTLLSAALAANSGMLQLQAAVASLTLVQVLGIDGLLGLGPAIVLASGALVAPFAGRAMDRVGRVPVLAVGFAIGAAGGVFAAIGCAAELAVLVLTGFVLVGVASGTALLARTAAGDMYPPEHRAHGIALVLFGAVFGAILGPAVFSPLLHGKHLDGDALAPLWLAGSGFMLVALVLVLMVRPDPKRIAELLDTGDPPPTTQVPLREIIARPGVIPAMLAAQASFGVMVGVMTLTGAVVVDHQHHAAHNVFPIIGAHVIGMYALVLVVGRIIDRIGRQVGAIRWSRADGAVGDLAAVDRQRRRDRRGALRPRPGLELLVRGRHRRAGGQHAAVGARPADRLQRPAQRPDRRGTRPTRRRGARNPGRGRAGPRRGRAGVRSGAVARPTQARGRNLGAACPHRVRTMRTYA